MTIKAATVSLFLRIWLKDWRWPSEPSGMSAASPSSSVLCSSSLHHWPSLLLNVARVNRVRVRVRTKPRLTLTLTLLLNVALVNSPVKGFCFLFSWFLFLFILLSSWVKSHHQLLGKTIMWPPIRPSFSCYLSSGCLFSFFLKHLVQNHLINPSPKSTY